MRVKLRQKWKPLDFEIFFLLSSPGLYPPAPHFQIFVLNFAIHHGDSTVSAFISNPTAVHRTPLAPHRPPILCTSGCQDEILEGDTVMSCNTHMSLLTNFS